MSIEVGDYVKLRESYLETLTIEEQRALAGRKYKVIGKVGRQITIRSGNQQVLCYTKNVFKVRP